MIRTALYAMMAALTIIQAPLSLYNPETKESKDMSQNPVIVDLDFCGDVDDAVAIRMATTLDAMHVCTLKAVMMTVTDPKGGHAEAKAAHGILCYDGYGNIPIGLDPTGYKEKYATYWDALIPYSTSEPITKDAVTLYKEILKKSYNKVTIITTGYLTNIEALLKDPEGKKLLSEKCEKLVIMGGSKGKWDNNFGFHTGAKKATTYVNDNFEGEMIYVPQETAGDVKAGGIIQKKNPNDPIAKALLAWGTKDGRAAWDPCTVMIGCLPEDSLPIEYRDIKATFDEDGSCTFTFYKGRTGVRLGTRKTTVSAAQLQNMIEGILGYQYSGG